MMWIKVETVGEGHTFFNHHYEGHTEVAKIIKTTTYDMILQSVPEYTAEG